MAGFRGTVQGNVQTDYFDHPLPGFPGQLATLGDPSNVDGYPVSGTTNIIAGRGVARGAALTASTTTYYGQSAPYSVTTVGTSTTLALFEGIAVRTEGMTNDDNGLPVYMPDQMASVASRYRSGCRVFVETFVAITARDQVHMYVNPTDAVANPVGTFTNVDVSGETIDLSTVARWYANAPTNSVGIIELAF